MLDDLFEKKEKKVESGAKKVKPAAKKAKPAPKAGKSAKKTATANKPQQKKLLSLFSLPWAARLLRKIFSRRLA